MVDFFPPNIWQMMTFLNPLDALIPKIPFSFSPDFWVWVTSKAWKSDSVGFCGSCQLSPFWGRGGSGRRALSTPPPPETKTRPPLLLCSCIVMAHAIPVASCSACGVLWCLLVQGMCSIVGFCSVYG